MNNTRWHTHTPPTGQRAWVWNQVRQELATWDGAVWRNVQGAVLVGIIAWRGVDGAVSGVTT